MLFADRLEQVLNLWLKKQYDTKRYPIPSWRSLCVAVHSGGENPALANDIAAEHRE